ncbi:MAG TPA: VOC family protein [Dehalococcoidia bacterium]|jgi:catechol 2,3-dioxygenase-like lactoylglutathione lyase family enzyme|nr:VOC family protein [Dehalococcoidia bacterium]
MTILGLHHVQINVPASRADEARRFFADILGLEEMTRPDSLKNAGRNGVWYRCGDNEFHVFFAPDGEFQEDRSSRHPAFLVTDLDDLRARLDSAGVPLEEAIPINGRERFFCRDPFGHRLEFLSFV